MLLYATEGAMWHFPSRVTYSFVPDGASIGGISSNMFATLNASYPTATWQAQFEKTAATWETYSNVNLALVSDNGEALGANGNQQDDPNVGDIRISMIPMGTNGVLAYAVLPPPLNGGTEAGDIVFNSSYAWGINNSNYDIETVTLHEMGHALGLGESVNDPNAVMYPYYTGTNQSPDADDQAGIASIYGAPTIQGTNKTQAKATDLSYLISNNQIAQSGLHLSGATDVDWWSVTVPSTTTGTMTVSMQSTDLSSLSPRVLVYQGTHILGQAALPNVYGGTATVTVSGVYGGEVITFRDSVASSPGAYGAFGVLVNFGSGYQAPIAPSNTIVAWAPGQGGGSADLQTPGGVTAVTPGKANATGLKTSSGNGQGYSSGSGQGNSSTDPSAEFINVGGSSTEVDRALDQQPRPSAWTPSQSPQAVFHQNHALTTAKEHAHKTATEHAHHVLTPATADKSRAHDAALAHLNRDGHSLANGKASALSPRLNHSRR